MTEPPGRALLLRRLLRRRPALRRRLLRLLRPVMPELARVVRWLEGPPYRAWFDDHQDGRPEEDEAVRAHAGAEPPLFHLVLRPGPGEAATRESATAQVGARHRLLPPGEAPSEGWMMALRPGDRLVRHALALLSAAARAEPRPLVLYGDEDAWGRRGPRDPWLKTALDPDRLLQQSALGRAVAYDAGLLSRHGLLGLSGHALALAATRAALAEAGPGAVRHLPAILLHRGDARARPWRDETDAAAVSAALDAAGEGASVAPGGGLPLRLRWPLPEPAPLVSALVPTRDAAALTAACVEGLLRRTDYPALEVILLDNDSTDPALLALLRGWSADPRFRALPCPGPFNYAAVNNRGAREARGEVLLLLNNDAEVRHPGWLREMVGLALRPGVGAVGARLLYPSGRLQHAGVVLGLGGVAGHDLLHARPRDDGPQDQLRLLREVSAVTAACLAIRRGTFLSVGGFDEAALRVAYNDVDLCLRLRARGFRNLVTPHAELRHKESATRGDDMAPEHRARWEGERAVMRERWGDALDADPFHSPHLALDPPTRQLAWPPRRPLPWRGTAPGGGAASPRTPRRRGA